MRVSKPPGERRAELVAAARLLFDQKGVGSTRVSDIVKHVGVAQGVFYYYFSSKEEMVDEVVHQVAGEVKQRVHAIYEDTGREFAAKLAAYIDVYIDVIDQFLGDDETSLEALADGNWDGTITAQGVNVLEASLDTLVQQGVKSGAITAAYPAESARVLLFGLRQLAGRQLPTRRQVYAIVEQGLGLPPGALLAHLPPAKAGKGQK